MGRSVEDLKAAFAGESQANRRYATFAKKADDEGFKQVAKLFRAASEAEAVHAYNHMRRTGELKSTAENVAAAISGETYEFEKMYPEFLATAKQEKDERATWSFDVARQVEQIHAGLYSKAAEALKNKQDLASIDYYVCNVCGNTVEGEAPNTCPICGAPKKAFIKIT